MTENYKIKYIPVEIENISVDENQQKGYFEVIASVEVVDLDNDIVMVDGISADYSHGVPMFYEHGREKVLGLFSKGYAIEYEGKKAYKMCGLIDLDDTIPSSLTKEQKYGVRKLIQNGQGSASIGFRVLERELYTDTNGEEIYKITKSKLMECSFVFNPANPGAKFLFCKSEAKTDEEKQQRKELQEAMLRVMEINHKTNKEYIDKIIDTDTIIKTSYKAEPFLNALSDKYKISLKAINTMYSNIKDFLHRTKQVNEKEENTVLKEGLLDTKKTISKIDILNILKERNGSFKDIK